MNTKNPPNSSEGRTVSASGSGFQTRQPFFFGYADSIALTPLFVKYPSSKRFPAWGIMASATQPSFSPGGNHGTD